MQIAMHEPLFYFWSIWGLLFATFYVLFLLFAKIFDQKRKEVLKYISLALALVFLLCVLTSSGFIAVIITLPIGLVLNHLLFKAIHFN